jgi:deazaflavin-dependent oxidoreductase (nitroreductase family)
MKSMAREDLTNVASQKFIHLTTTGRRTGNPHTVELWFAVSGARVYLSHEGKQTDWMMNIEKNGAVAFEIGGRHFGGKARWLEDTTSEAWTGKVALYEKYYGKATKEVIEDWFSLSKLLAVDLS